MLRTISKLKIVILLELDSGLRHYVWSRLKRCLWVTCYIWRNPRPWLCSCWLIHWLVRHFGVNLIMNLEVLAWFLPDTDIRRYEGWKRVAGLGRLKFFRAGPLGRLAVIQKLKLLICMSNVCTNLLQKFRWKQTETWKASKGFIYQIPARCVCLLVDPNFEAIDSTSWLHTWNRWEDLSWRSDARISMKYTLEKGTLSTNGRRSIRPMIMFWSIREAIISAGQSNDDFEHGVILSSAFIS